MLNVISSLRYIVVALLISGCLNDAVIKANQQRLDQQQVQLDQLKQEVAALQAQRPAYNSAPLPPGACDQSIMRAATRKGGERFAASDFNGALNYYQDALAACPNSAQANLNLARTYEALGDRAQAFAHYRTAAGANGPDTNSEAVGAARAALSRLGG
jgi:tetratricopeptide (TPR) repeat protein